MRKGLLAAAFVVLFAAPGAAWAADTARFGAELVDAISAADAAKKPPPRMTDPAWAPRFKEALDPAAIAAMDPADIGGMLGACQAASNAAQAYLDYGVQRTASSASPNSAEGVAIGRAQMANTAAYQDEIAVSLRYVLRCFAKTLTAMTDFTAKLAPQDMTDARKQGVAMVRDGTTNIYLGVVQTAMGLDGLRAVNRDLILDEAVARADVYAAAMRPSDRLKVRNAIGAALTRGLAPDVRAKLDRVAQAMGRKDCAGLCAI